MNSGLSWAEDRSGQGRCGGAGDITAPRSHQSLLIPASDTRWPHTARPGTNHCNIIMSTLRQLTLITSFKHFFNISHIKSKHLASLLPVTECPFVPFPFTGGSADSEGTAGVMLTIITSVTCHNRNIYWRLEPIISPPCWVHTSTRVSVLVRVTMSLTPPSHDLITYLLVTSHLSLMLTEC